MIIPSIVLLLPIAITVAFRWAVQRESERDEKSIWANYRNLGRFILAATVGLWWVVWDLGGNTGLSSAFFRTSAGAPEMASTQNWRFWLPPSISLGATFLLNSEGDKRLLGLKWTFADTLQQVWWKLVNYVFPLLMLAAGFELILDKKLLGIAWVLLAGVTRKAGRVFLTRAEGMKLNALKSGESRNRALRVARGMGVSLHAVFSIPAGKGHLTNAFGTSSVIGVTDSLGRYLSGGEMEFVIAHEVAHVKLKHTRTHSLLVATVVVGACFTLYFCPLHSTYLRLAVKQFALFAPLALFYYVSRLFEYAADREAVQFTQAPDTAVRALGKLHQARELPSASNRFTEFLGTHPTFEHRISAIAREGKIPPDHVERLLSQR